jgi:hypothetical protein
MPLLEGSPAIDAGDNGLAAGLSTDQRGSARVAGTSVDIGAFEVEVVASNAPPTVFADAPAVSATEGGSVSNTGTFGDPDGNGTVTLSASVGTVTQDNAAGTWSWSGPADDGPADTVTVTITATDDQDATKSVTFTSEVTNVAPTATLHTNSGVVYGSSATATLVSPFDPSSADTAAGFRYAFALDVDTTGSATYATSGASSSMDFGVIDAGTYTVFARVFDKDGGSTPYCLPLTVAKADATINVTGFSGTYDGMAHGATGSATGVGGVDLSAGLNLGPTYTNAPGGTASWSFSGGTNYHDASGSVAIDIARATSSVTLTASGGPYNGTAYAASVTVTGSGTITGSPTVTYYDNTRLIDLGSNAPINAGNYTVTAIYAGDANHSGSTGTATFTISPKILDATAVAPGTINIGSNGSIVLHIAVATGQLHGTDTVASLFNGTTFTIAIQKADGSTTYGTLTSTAQVGTDGSITVSMRMSDALRAELYQAYTNGGAVSFRMTATANGGSYMLDEDVLSRLLNNGAHQYVP